MLYNTHYLSSNLTQSPPLVNQNIEGIMIKKTSKKRMYRNYMTGLIIREDLLFMCRLKVASGLFFQK